MIEFINRPAYFKYSIDDMIELAKSPILQKALKSSVSELVFRRVITIANFINSINPQVLPLIKNKLTWFMGDADPLLQNSISFSIPSDRGNVAIVDPDMLSSNFYKDLRQTLAVKQIPFDERLDLLYWRGTLTGTLHREHMWRAIAENNKKLWTQLVMSQQRVQLCRISNLNGHVSAKITSNNQFTRFGNCVSDMLKSDKLISKYEPFINNIKYKYIIDIDGNSNSWASYFPKLSSGSCVFKIESPYGYSQWYYRYLRPWVHYIPVKSDLSDLEDKLDFARAHPKYCREIAQEARFFIESRTCRQWFDFAVNDFVASCLDLKFVVRN